MLSNDQVLKDLEQLINAHGYPVSGEFEFHHEDSMHMWGLFNEEKGFNGSPEKDSLDKAQQFQFFGSSGDGSIYALWHRAPGQTPVVYFGSEGNYQVLTKNLSDFISLLAIGYSDPGEENIQRPPASPTVSPWFIEYAKSIKANVPEHGAEFTADTRILNGEFLKLFFDTAFVTPDYNQFYFSNNPNTPVPEKVSDQDINLGYKIYPDGIVFYQPDSDLFYIEVSVHIFKKRADFDTYSTLQSTPLIMHFDDVWAHSISTEAYKFKPRHFRPGNYEVNFNQYTHPRPDSSSANRLYHIALYPID